MGRLVRHRATVSFDQIHAGNIYDLDLDEDPEWGPYIANGWFVLAPEFGEPEQPAGSLSGQGPDPSTAGPASTEPATPKQRGKSKANV